MDRISNDNAFTLVEVLIALAITAITAGALYSTYSLQMKAHVVQKQISEIQQNLRACIYLLESSIKQACMDPLGSAHPQILIADRHEFRFQADLNGNGLEFNPEEPTDDSAKSGSDENEVTFYRLSNDKDQNGIADSLPCRLGRATWAGVVEPMADNIEVLNFVYLDAQGNILSPLPLSPEKTKQIKTVEVTLIARSMNPDPKHYDNKKYYNIQGDCILNAQNDSYHRRSLSKTICLRNR